MLVSIQANGVCETGAGSFSRTVGHGAVLAAAPPANWTVLSRLCVKIRGVDQLVCAWTPHAKQTPRICLHAPFVCSSACSVILHLLSPRHRTMNNVHISSICSVASVKCR
jgi:hypothetical protein